MLLTALTVALLASNPQPQTKAKPAAEAKAADSKVAPLAKPHAHDDGTAAKDDSCHHPPMGELPAAPAPDAKLILRGEKIGADAEAVPVSKLLADSAKLDGSTVVVEGTVRKSCSSKGCWMELAASKDDKNPGVRVTFKDYALFVPLDSAGAQAKVAGQVKIAQLSEERAKHFAAEGATVPRGADGKPREVQMVATGVELRR